MELYGRNIVVDGQKIWNKVKEVGYNQYGGRKRFCKDSGFLYETLYNITTQRQKSLHVNTLKCLSKLLKCSPYDFIVNENNIVGIKNNKIIEKEKPFDELKRVSDFDWGKEINIQEENKEQKTTFSDLMEAVNSIEKHNEGLVLKSEVEGLKSKVEGLEFKFESKVEGLKSEIEGLISEKLENFYRSQVPVDNKLKEENDRLKEKVNECNREIERLKEESEKTRMKEKLYNKNVEKELLKKVRIIVERSKFKCNSTKAVEKCLGCTIEDFRKHIEVLFEEGMTWENHGKKFEEWQFDHIKQFTLFKLEDEREQFASCHYSNLRPLWSNENNKRPKPRRKGSVNSMKSKVSYAPC